jgi:hypothetical protein
MPIVLKAQVNLTAFDGMLGGVVDKFPLPAVNKGDLVTPLAVGNASFVRRFAVNVHKLKDVDGIVTGINGAV